MSTFASLIVLGAMLGSLFLSFISTRKFGWWERFWIDTCALVLFAGFLHQVLGFPTLSTGETAKGTTDDFALVAVLFLCMLLGMLAQVLYEHFSLPQRVRVRKKVDWGKFWSPVCASPIIFIPLMVTFQNANIELRSMTAPKMMIFLVAFQNGFFWKQFFDRRSKETNVVS